MSSKRRVRRRACERKVRYPDAYAASGAKNGQRRARLHVYHCKFCRGYHVGHIPRTPGTINLVQLLTGH